mmetsp:Transcript_14011/g.55915  ORF Transcript_14011/g.55915 Transcript_14011/m.55915 type:complete len:222 (+) Transcript_14011:76-741(+)
MAGQVWRMATYPSRAARERAGVEAVAWDQGAMLTWHRLDDGVMGGRSETRASATSAQALRFAGTINTEGGGFASVRAPLPRPLPRDATALRVRYRGDGRTYKVLLSNGETAGGPFSSNPSWQHDLPTSAGEEEADAELPLRAFRPCIGGAVSARHAGTTLDAPAMRELGLMLSLYRSDGAPNETFARGADSTPTFDFDLELRAIDVLVASAEEPAASHGDG